MEPGVFDCLKSTVSFAILSNQKVMRILLPVLLLPVLMFSQTTPLRQADFLASQKGDAVQFEPVLPPLIQRAGAPPAFYDHYWEFGDGDFSFEERPTHLYPEGGNYDVYYLATGKYDNGKAPRSRKKRTPAPEPREAVASANHVLPGKGASIGMKAVRNPRADEEFVCILSYANQSPVAQSGKLYLFFNERSWAGTHFNFLESRSHYGEETIAEPFAAVSPTLPSGWAGNTAPHHLYELQLPDRFPDVALAALSQKYKQVKAWQFGGLEPGQTRNLFVSLQATETMVKDTQAIISISALYLSDDQRIVEQYDLELEIVSSHDPNYMAVSRRRMGFRRVRSKDLTYKVHFQNVGQGPASRVQITCTVPQSLSTEKLRILDLQPHCPFCPQDETLESCLDTAIYEDRIVFTFRNIYLPGTRQSGRKDRDSTKGFIKYRLTPGRKIKKQNFSARASIVFDNNPPIRTNKAPTRFKPGLSLTPMVGRALLPQNQGEDQWQVGFAVAPYKPYRLFWQGEAWAGKTSETSTTESFTTDTTWIQPIVDASGTVIDVSFDSTANVEQVQSVQNTRYALVPLQLRYNLSGFLSIGAGGQLDIERRKISTEETSSSFVQAHDLATGQVLTQYSNDYPPQTTNNSKTKWSWSPAVFADVHLGSVRIGPAGGLRAVLPLNQGAEPWLLAFIYWKF